MHNNLCDASTFWATAPGATFLSMLAYPNLPLNLAFGCAVGYWLYKDEQKRKKENECKIQRR